jgi:ABC-type sugar transport system substrate-binding protein
MRKAVPLLVSLLAIFCVGLLAGCGEDDDTGTSTETSSGSSTASSGGPFVPQETADAFSAITGLDPLTKPATMADLEPRIAKYVATPTEILQTEPVSKKAEPGKNIALLVCGVPVCTEFNDAMNEAGDELGWQITKIDLGVSPEEFTKAYNRAIEIKPDMVVGSGLPRELFDKQLNTLADMDIPVIEWSSGIKPVPDELWVATDDPLYQAAGVQAAEFLAADGDLKSQVAIFNVPQYTMSSLFAKTLQEYLPKICADCKVGYEEAAATDIGKLGQKVTGYVQQNPDTNYVVCTFGDLCQGVGQALRSAGRDDVKVFTRDSGSTNFQNMANGLEYATSPLPIGQTGWQIVDLAQRIFNGDDVADTRLSPIQVVTKVDDPESPLIGAVPDYKEQYRALWKLDG